MAYSNEIIYINYIYITKFLKIIFVDLNNNYCELDLGRFFVCNQLNDQLNEYEV